MYRICDHNLSVKFVFTCQVSKKTEKNPLEREVDDLSVRILLQGFFVISSKLNEFIYLVRIEERHFHRIFSSIFINGSTETTNWSGEQILL